ncbi:flagellin [Clostridium sp. 2-1]|uniref:flagellin n=1 Tax=Clostridium TaxID=1485 RepID=UPI000CDB55FC|nr:MULTISPECIES: flagellin [Clostridium]MBN7573051.1 flagellin [Clostridium beijerinckii]MBN7578390.1 flagellin [Clostridium beijerinckii]MBN7582825.1 flagellin [Clostridium beijerinckii]MBO0518990.1 flagellin [Clostridium beijerinckii]POO93255.1 flagellin [Clostridium sp. 2-1]
MRLAHNMFSLSIYKTYKVRITDESKALNNISTGSKLSSAKDNPGKIGKNETLKIQVLTNDAASKNVQDTNSMMQTFDGSLQEINDNLSRIKELTVSAGSGTLTDSDKNNIQTEIDSIKADINSLANNTEFNGIKLSCTSASSLNLNPTQTIKSAIGNMSGESIDIPIFDLSTSNLGVDKLDINNVDSSLESVDKAIKMVGEIRSTYGSLQNRLEGTAEYLSSKDINIQTAQSRIGDADIAEEMMKYSKSQLLVNSSIGLMAQSNNFPKDCLNILANVK